MNYTTYLNLAKPEGTDPVSATPFNGNSDTLDGTIHTMQETIQQIQQGQVPQADIEDAVADYIDEHGVETAKITISTLSYPVNIVFSTTEPANPTQGMIWLQPVGE